MLKRNIQTELLEMSKTYPVVTVIGPRQSGKTTLVRALFPDKPYVSLENIDERELAEFDANGFLSRFPEGAILDEIQRQPTLLSYIQGIVDEKKEKGQFILTGSHQLLLHESITQSLAGRTAILKLMPLCLSEFSDQSMYTDIDTLLYQGMYPRLYDDPMSPTKYYRDYVQTYIERDVRQMIHLKDLKLFQNFIKLCAGRIGQIFIPNHLANELGVSNHTIENWISILEASFIVFRLSPYHDNFGKRVVKSSKLYFVDTGLASYLLDITNPKQIFRDPLKGGLFENFVIMECIKESYNRGYEPNFYFYRDSKQTEVDLIFKRGNELIPIEIKSSSTFHRQFINGLEKFKTLAKERCTQGYLIYNGEQVQTTSSFKIIRPSDIGDMITSLIANE